jgi:HAD superfamily hydrolase (TIGR01459 family)
LQALDVPAAAYAAIVTSGDVTRQFLAERQHQRVWIVGPDRDSGLYQGLTLTPSALQAAQFISCTGLFDDEVETPEDYRERLQWAQEQDLEMICANPDRVVQRGGRLIYCAGALAALYQELGGKTLMAGKPFAPIYDQALAEVARLCGAKGASPTLAVGDGLHTDVLGANARGLDCLLIAEGVHGEDLITSGGGLEAPRLAAALAEAGAHATLAMTRLAW